MWSGGAAQLRAATPGQQSPSAGYSVAFEHPVPGIFSPVVSSVAQCLGAAHFSTGHDGLALGLALGEMEGETLGEIEGETLGLVEGIAEGLALGLADGLALGLADGETLGLALGLSDGDSVGDCDGDTDGALTQQGA